MDIQELLADIGRRSGWQLTEDRGLPHLVLQLEGGRSQKVRASAFRDDGQEMIRFTSRIGPGTSLTEERCRKALELNVRLPHGCLALEDDHLVLTETQLLSAATPEASMRVIQAIARLADSYEKFIFGTDRH